MSDDSRLKTAGILAAVAACALVAGCERKGPCRAYDRTAEAVKGGAKITYCLSRNGLAQGPYTCVLENGLGSVSGRYKDGVRQGTWVFMGAKGEVIRRENWRDDRMLGQEELHPQLPALPEEITRLDCDGHLIRRADAKP